MTLVSLTSIAGGLLVITLFGLVFRSKVRDFDGRLIPAPTDIERLLEGFGARFFSKPDPTLARKLVWARIPIANTPPAWRALNLLGPISTALLGYIVVGGGAGNVLWGIILAAGGGFFAYLFISSRLDNVIDAREMEIAASVPAFMSSFARILAVRRDWVATMETIAQAAEKERAARGAGEALRRKAVRPNDFNPYASELYTGLIMLMARKNEGLIRRDASVERPDPLLEWAIWCDNGEIFELADAIRAATVQNRPLRAEEVDILENGFRARREERIIREAADAAARTTAILVIFNLPLLLAALIVPAIYGVIQAV